MIRYNIALIVILLIACLAQQFVPALGWLFDVRILLVAVVFLTGSVTGGIPMMLLMAYIAGFLNDSQHSLNPETGDPSIYIERVGSMPFGYSIILFAIMGAIILGFRPLFRSGKWEIPTAVTGLIIYFYLWAEFLLISVVRGGLHIDQEIFYKISFSALLTTVLAPALFFGYSKLALVCNHAIKNDNRRRFFAPDKV